MDRASQQHERRHAASMSYIYIYTRRRRAVRYGVGGYHERLSSIPGCICRHIHSEVPARLGFESLYRKLLFLLYSCILVFFSTGRPGRVPGSVCVCVCVCIYSVCLCVCIYIVCLCVCVCIYSVCPWVHGSMGVPRAPTTDARQDSSHTVYTHIHTYIHTLYTHTRRERAGGRRRRETTTRSARA
jgi:hypothetical protein